MTRLLPTLFMLFLLTLLAIPRVSHAAQGYDNCTGVISSIPAVISTQGIWCLKSDLSTANVSGNAITINANNVTIDCNDFKLGGLAAGPGTLATGIAAVDRFNITIRRCNIRGFYFGLDFDSASHNSGGAYLVEDNRFDGNTYFGMNVEGDNSMIRRNRMFNTGGSSWIQDATGIYATYSVDIMNNTVSNVVAKSGGNGNAYGIITSTNLDGRIIGNRVSGVAKDGTGVGEGIYNVSSGRISIRDNDIFGSPSATNVALTCGSANGRARNNTINGYASALATCNNSGGNAILP